MKLTEKQKILIGDINGGALRKKSNGDFYYSVPVDTRRSGQMLVKKEFVNRMKKAGLITIEI